MERLRIVWERGSGDPAVEVDFLYPTPERAAGMMGAMIEVVTRDALEDLDARVPA